MSNSRLEKFIYAICGMDVDDLPTPLSRIETLWNCLITGEMPDFEPLSRNEKYLMAMLNGDVDGLPEPTSRGEKLLYKIATGETDLSDVPGYLSRYEELLKQLIENGGIGGTDFEYVLYTLNQPLSTLYSTAEDTINTATIYGDTVVNTLQEPSDLAVTPIGENIDISNTTVDGTVEGKVKSAILSGNSEVVVGKNKCNMEKIESGWIDGTTGAVNDSEGVFIPVEVSGTITISNYIHSNIRYVYEYDANGKYLGRTQVTTDIVTLVLTQNTTLIKIGFYKGTLSTVKSLQLQVEQGEIATEYEPYNPTLVSVKMPVLTTTGKNLANSKMEMGNIRSSDGRLYDSEVHIRTKDYIPINDSIKTVTLSNDKGYIGVIFEYDKDYKFIKYTTGKGDTTTATLSDNCRFVKFRTTDSSNATDLTVLFQLEQGTQATTYEPYKSNILSTPSDLVLRGIGTGSNRVEDELNCLTGEVVERIGEVVLNGGENWVAEDTRFRLSRNDIIPNKWSNGISNYFIGNRGQLMSGADYDNYFAINGYGLCLYVRDINLFPNPKSQLNEFKSWLSERNAQGNPVILQYCLSQEVIKTVDLSIIDQDGNEASHLHTFNDTTHISTSAECLLPNVVIPADISYPSIIKANTLYTVKLKRPVTNGNLLINLGGTEQLVTSDCFTIQTPATLTSQNVIFSGKGNVISEVTVVEGDHTEKEYGYFEGMMSVKMPVLTTTTSQNLSSIPFSFFEKTTDRKYGAWTIFEFDNLFSGKIIINKRPFNTIMYFDTKENRLNIGTTVVKDVQFIAFYNPSTNIENNNKGNLLELLKSGELDLSLQENGKTNVYSYKKNDKTNILTTTSKNLFDMNRPYDAITDSQATVVQDTNQITVSSSAESGIYVNVNFILDKDFFAGKTVTGSCLYESDENDIGTVQIAYQDGNGEYHYQWIKTPKTFTFPNSFIGDVMLSVSANNTDTPQSNTVTVKNIQLELGSTATPYEPYSEVVLRGIGEVKDTLDGNSGVLTKRIGEIVLDGSEDWKIWYHTDNILRYMLKAPEMLNTTNLKVKSDKLPSYGYNINKEGIFGNNGSLIVILDNSDNKLNGNTIVDFKAWLSQNPIIVQYQLANGQNKTVDLSILDQDGATVEKLNTFKDITHVSCSVDEGSIYPYVEMEVATSNDEDLAAIGLKLEEKNKLQCKLIKVNDYQSDVIDNVMLGITEIYESI